MASITFTIKYGKNEGLSISPSELVSQYLFGLELCTKDGKTIPNETIVQKIFAAQEKIQKFLSLRLNREVISEQRDFLKGDYNSWGYLTTSFQIKDILSLEGFINTTRQVQFPAEWISKFKATQEDILVKTLHIVPAGNTTPTSSSVVFAGLYPNIGYFGIDGIPNYWTIKYVTGFDTVPAELREALSKMAAIELLAIIGDLVLSPGMASQTLAYDGLSQAMMTTKSPNTSAYAARIKQYADDLALELPRLKDWYKGLTFGVM